MMCVLFRSSDRNHPRKRLNTPEAVKGGTLLISALLPQTSVVSRQTCREGRPRLSRSTRSWIAGAQRRLCPASPGRTAEALSANGRRSCEINRRHTRGNSLYHLRSRTSLAAKIPYPLALHARWWFPCGRAMVDGRVREVPHGMPPMRQSAN